MATIKEDYVSFECAKLLKEKGFNESCYTYYDDIDDTINRFDKGYHFNNTSYPWGVPYDVSKAKKYIVAPTLQMAMKWLREEHNISIEISSCCKIANCEPVDLGWAARKIDLTKMVGSAFLIGRYDTYEMACEAAIKYCLENLI